MSSIMELLRKHRETYNTQQLRLDRIKASELEKLQAQCGKETGHEWEWVQIAGEGRICKTCGYHDWSAD